jgi:hypothetical protein
MDSSFHNYSIANQFLFSSYYILYLEKRRFILNENKEVLFRKLNHDSVHGAIRKYPSLVFVWFFYVIKEHIYSKNLIKLYRKYNNLKKNMWYSCSILMQHIISGKIESITSCASLYIIYIWHNFAYHICVRIHFLKL